MNLVEQKKGSGPRKPRGYQNEREPAAVKWTNKC